MMYSEHWAFSMLRSTHLNAHPYYIQNNNTITLCVYFVIICFWFDCCAFNFRSYSSYSDCFAIWFISTSWRLKFLTMIFDGEWLLVPASKASTQPAHELLCNDVVEVFQYFSLSFYGTFSWTLCWNTSLHYGNALNTNTHPYIKKTDYFLSHS